MPNRKSVKCVIIDDEPYAREILRQHISGIETLELVESFSSAIEAFPYLNANHVDLMFLDIEMPQLLGTDFIRTLKQPPKVIFTTAYRKYAVEGFELDAVDYILKPISFPRFLKAVNKALQVNFQVEPVENNSPQTLPENKSSFLYFRVDRKMVKIHFKDILYIESLKDYIKIITSTKSIVTKYVLTTLEEILPAQEFLRIHKSFIVAINKIESYNAESVQISKYELPIGRLYKHDVSRTLNLSTAVD